MCEDSTTDSAHCWFMDHGEDSGSGNVETDYWPEEVEKNITTAVWPNQARDLGGGNTIVIPCNKTVQLWQGIT